MKKNYSFEKIIKEKIKLGKPTIAFGLAKPDKEILKSLVKSRKYASIILVGPPKIKNVKGFKKIITNTPERKLANMLYKEEVQGIVRGTVDDFKTLETYQSLIGEYKAKKEIELTLIEDFYGRQFFISEGSNPRGWNKKEKIKSSEAIANFLKQELGASPKIGVITGIRHDTYRRKKSIKTGVQGILNQTYKDAEDIVKYFKNKGIKAKNYAIELQTAVQDGCNIIIPPNGMVGNQIFRALCLLGGGKLLTASRANLPHPYEDNSRNEIDFEAHIKWLVAWINSKKNKK